MRIKLGLIIVIAMMAININAQTSSSASQTQTSAGGESAPTGGNVSGQAGYDPLGNQSTVTSPTGAAPSSHDGSVNPKSIAAVMSGGSNCAEAQALVTARKSRWNAACYAPSTAELQRMEDQYRTRCDVASSSEYLGFTPTASYCTSGTSSCAAWVTMDPYNCTCCDNCLLTCLPSESSCGSPPASCTATALNGPTANCIPNGGYAGPSYAYCAGCCNGSSTCYARASDGHRVCGTTPTPASIDLEELLGIPKKSQIMCLKTDIDNTKL